MTEFHAHTLSCWWNHTAAAWQCPRPIVDGTAQGATQSDGATARPGEPAQASAGEGGEHDAPDGTLLGFVQRFAVGVAEIERVHNMRTQ